MSFIKFNKEELVNLDYSLHKEILSTNRAGSYLSTTIIGCNTRKYHGLFVTPIDEFDGERHVLLSSVDETLVEQNKEFNLAIHKFPDLYYPKGHKYIVDFEYEPLPTIEYIVGGLHIRKELLMVHNEEQVLIRYTILSQKNPTLLRLKPFLAFRNAHQLTKANDHVNVKHKKVAQGLSVKMYDGFPRLYLQTSFPAERTIVNHWHYNFEYQEEQQRGYDYREDLFLPVYFETQIKEGDVLIFSASLTEVEPTELESKFEALKKQRVVKDSFKSCLKNAAKQFLVKNKKDTEVVAGYPWFGQWGRDTFIALPGITLSTIGDKEECEAVLDSMTKRLKNGLFPNIGRGEQAAFNSVDAPLWFFWAVQQLHENTNDTATIIEKYLKYMVAILDSFKTNNLYVTLHDNGLLWVEAPGKALTWMDAIVHGVPVTPRNGYQVEINALWYNAVCYVLQLSENQKLKNFDRTFWKNITEKIEKNYTPLFWVEERQHLADFVGKEGQNIFTRPNQIFATSLQYSPISDDTKRKVLTAVSKELLTNKGLRTLSPKNPLYIGRYEGTQPERDMAYHQGTVWPWLIGHFIEGNLKLYGESYVKKAEYIIQQFEEDMNDYGIGSIPEIYDGDPPHLPNGSISQAWSVGEILRAIRLIEKYKK